MKVKVFTFIYFILLINLSFTAEKDYTNFVKDLQIKITQSPFKHVAYQKLAYISDTYGPRMWGSK